MESHNPPISINTPNHSCHHTHSSSPFPHPSTNLYHSLTSITPTIHLPPFIPSIHPSTPILITLSPSIIPSPPRERLSQELKRNQIALPSHASLGAISPNRSVGIRERGEGGGWGRVGEWVMERGWVGESG